MKRPASRCLNDRGLDETVSVILMVILVIAVAAIIASIVFGLAVFFPKSAYIAVQTEAKNASPDNWYLSVFHMNGDAAYLNHTLATNDGMPVDFQFTNSTIGTVIPKPDPADGPETWNPGDTLFVYRNQSGGVWVTKNEALAINETKKSGAGLPQGVWRFDVVDKTDGVLIYTKNLGVGVAEPTTIPTSTPNTTVTTTVTTVNTTIPTTNVTTVPTTVTPPCGTISGKGQPNWVINVYKRKNPSDAWVYSASTTTDSIGNYIYTDPTYLTPNYEYELREAYPSSRIIDTALQPGHCYKININF
jgi:hypothetical protein